MGVSKHYKKSRTQREKLIKKVIGGDGNDEIRKDLMTVPFYKEKGGEI